MRSGHLKGKKLCVNAAEYMVMKPLAPKQEDVAAFISNCAAKSFRLQALEALRANLSVHSYGRCMHNKDTSEPKPNVLQRYRFTLAFENSQVLLVHLVRMPRLWQICAHHDHLPR